MSRADWSEAPDWAQWWAVDSAGSAFWYENKPSVYDLMWAQLSEGDHTYAGQGDPTNWRESLERRPPDSADNINHPAHYQSDAGVECIDAIHAALGDDGFVAHCRGTAMKYVFRAGKKGSTAEDLRKAAWYLGRAARAMDSVGTK